MYFTVRWTQPKQPFQYFLYINSTFLFSREGNGEGKCTLQWDGHNLSNLLSTSCTSVVHPQSSRKVMEGKCTCTTQWARVKVSTL